MLHNLNLNRSRSCEQLDRNATRKRTRRLPVAIYLLLGSALAAKMQPA